MELKPAIELTGEGGLCVRGGAKGYIKRKKWNSPLTVGSIGANPLTKDGINWVPTAEDLLANDYIMYQTAVKVGDLIYNGDDSCSTSCLIIRVNNDEVGVLSTKKTCACVMKFYECMVNGECDEKTKQTLSRLFQDPTEATP